MAVLGLSRRQNVSGLGRRQPNLAAAYDEPMSPSANHDQSKADG
jgi:hypothetical protein